MNRQMIESIFPGTLHDIDSGVCPHCKKTIGVFKDALSAKEYKISGLCQECQDAVFG